MPDSRVTYLPPPRIPGVSSPPTQDGLMRELAGMAGGGDGQQQEMAGPLLMQGMTALQQAATLDPRIAPLIQKALSVLQGGIHAPNARAGQSGGSMSASPGGVVPV